MTPLISTMVSLIVVIAILTAASFITGNRPEMGDIAFVLAFVALWRTYKSPAKEGE